jgi:hypothetical protein
VFKDDSNTWTQIGVVSFGSSKGCLHGPSGYSRVTSFLGWISNKVGQGQFCCTLTGKTVGMQPGERDRPPGCIPSLFLEFQPFFLFFLLLIPYWEGHGITMLALRPKEQIDKILKELKF